MSSRTLYLARHGEADATGELTPAGRTQAEALGARMGGVDLDVIWHSPLPRAVRTAGIVAAHCPGVPVGPSELAGDYPPSDPDTARLPESHRQLVRSYGAEELAAGAELARRAERWLTEPSTQDTRELVVTHNFLIAWMVRLALDGPDWRWLGLNQCNAAITVIRCRDGYPPALLGFNDMDHLPEDLRWTGFPPHLRS